MLLFIILTLDQYGTYKSIVLLKKYGDERKMTVVHDFLVKQTENPCVTWAYWQLFSRLQMPPFYTIRVICGICFILGHMTSTLSYIKQYLKALSVHKLIP